MSEREITFAGFFRESFISCAGQLRVALPGRIESFDAASQTASVKPQIKDYQEADTGVISAVALPVVNGVPVLSLSGGDYGLQFPVQAGDTCLLVFTDRSIDKWVSEGGDVDPSDVRQHHLSDAIAIVGLKNDKNQLNEYDAAAIQLGKQGGPRVRVTATEVHLGGSSGETTTEQAMHGTTYVTQESAFLTSLNAMLAVLLTTLPILAAGLTPPNPGAIQAVALCVEKIIALQSQIGTFQAGNYLSATVKVK